MELDDELENFIKARKARVVQDKASLEQDPPYIEIKPESHSGRVKEPHAASEIQTKPHKVYGGSAVKENIPPKSTAHGKDESVGLPLGVEYEKKKHRLQCELRMDYRRYMAQNPLEDSTSIFPKQQSRLQRDAATMTEDRGYRVSDDDGGFLSVLSRHHHRRGRPTDLENKEDEELFQDELLGGRKRQEIANEQTNEKSQNIRINNREKRDNRGDLRRDERRIRTLNKNENADFATGLIIGACDTDEALQRRKERYRQELQEQIAEQHLNKKKEKELELKVAATGANDPEKQPDRIKQFGLSRRKAPQDSEATGEHRSSSRTLSSSEKDISRERELPFPPEQLHAAFQSPLLEYSSALGFGEGGLSPCGQPAATFLPSSMDFSRNPLFVPHPPPSLSGVYRTPYIEPYQFFGTRNQPDPNMAYYGHPSAPNAGFPVSCWNVPPGTAAPNQFSNHSPHTEPPMISSRPTNETATDSQAGSFQLVRPRSTKGRTLNYGEALKQQEASSRGSFDLYSKIQEQQQRKRVEREENERYEAQLEVEMRTLQPWGKGGGGAPLRDSSGNLIADLNRMHKLNEEAYINPEQWQRRATAARMAHKPEQPDPNERVSGFTRIQTPQFARGNVFTNQPTEQQLKEQDQYKAFLKQQIEEKMRQKAEERERIRLEEEKEEKRLAEQRARIQREYEEEQEKKKQKEMEQKAKNEELIQLAEQRKREAEQKRREMEEKENAALRQYERERRARDEVHREPLPPIPALQRKHGHLQHTPRPPTHDSQHSRAPLTSSQSGLQSPPVPACRNQLRAAGAYRDVFNELSALRQQLRSEQKRLECRLQQDDWEELDSPMSVRSQERPAVDVFDMARLRLQAPVRRPSSRNVDPRNLRNHESLRLKHADGESRLGFCKDAKLEETSGTNQRIRDYSDSYHQFSDHRSTVLDDYLDLSPPRQTNHLRGDSRGSERDSQPRSESAFIDSSDDASPVPHTPKLDDVHQLSARERRRLSKQSQHAQERAVSSQLSGRRNDWSSHSSYRPQQEAEEGGDWRIRNMTGRLTAISRRGNADGPTSNSAELNTKQRSVLD